MNRPTLSPAPTEPSTRQRFLEAGARVFVREGYVAASMELVSKEAGLSRAALYKHFENKAELFTSIAEMIHESAAAASAERKAHALAALVEPADAIVHFMAARHQRFRDLLGASTHATELMEESSRRCGPLIRHHAQLFRAALIELIAELVSSGRMPLQKGMSATLLADMLLAAEAGLKAGDASFLSAGYKAAFDQMARTLVAGARSMPK